MTTALIMHMMYLYYIIMCYIEFLCTRADTILQYYMFT